jgi:hypothetical protein
MHGGIAYQQKEAFHYAKQDARNVDFNKFNYGIWCM